MIEQAEAGCLTQAAEPSRLACERCHEKMTARISDGGPWLCPGCYWHDVACRRASELDGVRRQLSIAREQRETERQNVEHARNACRLRDREWLEVRQQYEAEKKSRIGWQDRVYAICRALDAALDRKPVYGQGVTVDEAGDAIAELVRQRDDAKRERAEAVRCQHIAESQRDNALYAASCQRNHWPVCEQCKQPAPSLIAVRVRDGHDLSICRACSAEIRLGQLAAELKQAHLAHAQTGDALTRVRSERDRLRDQLAAVRRVVSITTAADEKPVNDQ